ncbi:putative 30S ribosomal protein S16 [Cardiosporidium cionae]|uniref:30S ribosomal protein S16 n=1 Tax=Cardiosporidium cionae TaxID=476202 RepID=A0ABQ7J536_9APIC|nr:putative 30S ribosomal protein S16 [Cardiosporidium cionae]|eukprot:KAF8819131.1 putative 30S ribosomal protein S16 [Cardiosporidium cionae]
MMITIDVSFHFSSSVYKPKQICVRFLVAMVRRMFIPYFSKLRGPPRIRMQVQGIRGKRFYKIVAANQRDPRDGKHIEVLGSYAPHTSSGSEEIRLRFTRIKFWLAVGAFISPSMRSLLGLANLIPSAPPPFGRRTMGQHHLLQQISKEQAEKRKLLLQSFYKNPDPVDFYPLESADDASMDDSDTKDDGRKSRPAVRRVRRILY